MQQENKNIATNTYVEMFRQNISTKSKGFTLVELIIVITILSILATIAFISFQGYTKDARDGIRMSDIKQIYNGLSIYKTQTEKTLLPDNYINIQSGTTTISYQGYAGTSVLRTLKISGGKDPGTKDYYIYTTDVNTKKAQLMTYMETADKDIQYLSQFKSLKLIQQAEATNSGYYQDKKIYVYGDKIGILTNNKVPLQETTTNTGIDITTLTGNITTYFGGNVYSGGLSTSTGLTLINQINGAISNTLPCSSTIYNGYNITSLQDKQNQTFTKTGTIIGGTQTGSILTTCNNGTLSYGTESFQTSCGANFTLNGNVCNAIPVLLLHGDNVSTPASFLDSSSSNKLVTRNGDTIQVVGGKMSGGGYFDGNGDYFRLDDSEDWNFGTGDFTIDFWVKLNSFNRSGQIMRFFNQETNNTNETYLYFSPSGGLGFISYVGGVSTISFSQNSISSWSINTWNHVALVRSGNNFYLFQNGNIVANTNSNVTLPNWTGQLFISSRGSSYIEQQLNGNLDEFRISKGIARWTSNFTPLTTEYTTDSYTKLLLHFNGNGNSFTDDSGTSKAITANGNAIQHKMKFGNGSMYFDGSSSYLSVGNSSDFEFGSGDFTIDWWEYRTSSTPGNIVSRDATTIYAPFFAGYGGSGGGTINFYATSDGLSWNIANGNSIGTIILNTWTHYAVTRKGTIFYTFQNGIQQSTWTSSLSLISNSNPLSIGRSQTNYYYSGYIDELRIVKGAALRTSNFTPPTTPY